MPPTHVLLFNLCCLLQVKCPEHGPQGQLQQLVTMLPQQRMAVAPLVVALMTMLM
jgi:hypothetical protein